MTLTNDYDGTPTLRTGSLAYYDTFAGLIPCRVLSIQKRDDCYTDTTIALTATRGAYKRGEQITTGTNSVIPRAAVHYSCGIARIWPYRIEVSND